MAPTTGAEFAICGDAYQNASFPPDVVGRRGGQARLAVQSTPGRGHRAQQNDYHLISAWARPEEHARGVLSARQLWPTV
jgi:hypothetical protein